MPEGEPAREIIDVAIVGGGPVGLWLALCLARAGLVVRVFERRHAPSAWSRAIGIHPPALDCLAEVGVLEALATEAVPIVQAQAFAGRVRLGSADFSRLATRHPYALSVPQSLTERALERGLSAIAPEALWRDSEVLRVCEQADGVSLEVATPDGPIALRARVLVGCDGKRSLVRKALGASFLGASYGDGFVMGDFPDHTGLGESAFVCLSADGVVESFPLPHGRRRWVARVGEGRPRADAGVLAHLVHARTGHAIDPHSALAVSAFEAEHYQTTRFASARMALAGDAAHVLSPLGGQGMNLGLLDAQALARGLVGHFRRGLSLARTLRHYAADRQRAAIRAERRAGIYLRFARPSRRLQRARGWLVQALLSRWLKGPATAQFAMLEG